MNYLLIEIVIFILLIILSGFFASSETSLFSLKKTDLTQMSQNNLPRTNLIKQMLAQPRRLIITILIGNELVNIIASVISASAIIRIFGQDNLWFNILIMVPMLLLFGEIVPKTLGVHNNRVLASFTSRPIEWFARLIKPLRWVIENIADFFVTNISDKKQPHEDIITEDMMRTIAYDAVDKGELDNQEAIFIDQILSFDDKTIKNIMTPRSHIFFLPAEISLHEMVAEMQKIRHTKAPVYRENRDTIIGVLHLRALLGVDIRKESYTGDSKEKLFLPPYFVPESKLASELFSTFRERKISLALTVDEYGGVTGLVTMEDLLECIFGDIHSPSDINIPKHIKKIAKNTFLLDAGMKIIDFNKKIGAELSDDKADTVSGFLLHHCGELPAINTSIKTNNLNFKITAVKNNRISEVLVKTGDK